MGPPRWKTSLRRWRDGVALLLLGLSSIANAQTVDLVLGKSASAETIPVNSTLHYTLTVSNIGERNTWAVALTDTLPTSVELLEVVVSQGSWERQGRQVICRLGDLGIRSTAQIDLIVRAQAAGWITNTATATAQQPDATTANNTAQVVTRVEDNVPPEVFCPETLVTNTAPGQCSQTVVFTVRAVDNSDPQPTVTCTPSSGSVFPKGETWVTCSAMDSAGNRSKECHFLVVVRDLEQPQIACPGNIVTETDPGLCAKRNITYTVSATDNCPGVTVACDPPSGSTFPIGVTTVTCEAIDSSGNTNTCSFTVTIQDTRPPAIVAGPQSLEAHVGDPVAFSVVASGAPPLCYQWYFGDYPIPEGTNDTFSLVSARPAHAGDYAVLVSNPFGSAGSPVATLTLDLTYKKHRWTREALDTALRTPVFASLRSELEARGFQPLPLAAQVQWVFDVRGKDPKPVCHAITVPFKTASDSALLAAVGVLLGVVRVEDGPPLGERSVLGGIALLADQRGERQTILRVICDTNGVCGTAELVDEQCLAAWFASRLAAATPPFPPPNTYVSIVADVVSRCDACGAAKQDPGGQAAEDCRAAGRGMAAFMVATLGSCPGAQGALNWEDLLPRPLSEAEEELQATRDRGLTTGQGLPDTPQTAQAKHTPLDGTDTCCPPAWWVEVTYGLTVLFDAEDEWCAALADPSYAVLEGEAYNSYISTQDNPLTHDSLDWIIKVKPDSAYQWLASQCNEKEGAHTIIDCEWESDYIPDFIKPWPGDRVWMRGQVIFDCPHVYDGGYHSEIHPPHAMVVIRQEGAPLRASGPLAMPATVARVYITAWCGEANHHDLDTEGGTWSSSFNADGTPYHFKVPLPAKPSGCDLDCGSEPPILVRIAPVASLALPAYSSADSGSLRITRQLSSNADLQEVINAVLVSLWPNSTLPTHLDVKVPMTSGFSSIGDGISPIQFTVAVGWNDELFSLDLQMAMPLLDSLTNLHCSVTGSAGSLALTDTQPLASGRTLVPPDQRTLLRIVGPDCAATVRALRVDFTKLSVWDDRDLASNGEWRLRVGANGPWTFVHGLNNVDDDGPPIALNLSLPVRVWRATDPKLQIQARGYEDDGVLHPVDILGSAKALYTASENFGAGTATYAAVGERDDGDYWDYQIYWKITDEDGVCQKDTFDPANDTPVNPTAVSAPGKKTFLGLTLVPGDSADWFALDTDDYMTVVASVSNHTSQNEERCHAYDLEINTARALILPDRFDDGKMTLELCSSGGAISIQEGPDRNESWAASPLLQFCPSAWSLTDYNPGLGPLLVNYNPPNLVLKALNFHLPYPGVDSKPDEDFFRIKLPPVEFEACGAPVSTLLGCKAGVSAFDAGLTILIESDRDRSLDILVTNFTSGFAIDNDPKTAEIPDDLNLYGKGRSWIERKGTTTTITLECPQASGNFPDGIVGLRLRDPEGQRNFYDLTLAYNAQAFCTPQQLLTSPGEAELIRGKIFGCVDPIELRTLRLISYRDPVDGVAAPFGLPFARAKTVPFVDVPAPGTAGTSTDRWLVLLPRADAVIDIFVEAPLGVPDFNADIALHDLDDQVVGRAQLVPTVAHGAGRAIAVATQSEAKPLTQHYRMVVQGLAGTFYTFKVDRTHFGASYFIQFAFSRAPVIAVEPDVLAFGSRTIEWRGAPLTVTVRNHGNADLTVAKVVLEGAGVSAFALTGLPDMPATLSPGSRLDLGVSFRASSVGTNAADVVILSDDPKANPVRIPVSGSGKLWDTEGPQLTCPTEVVAWTCTNGAPVEYTVAVTDDGSTNIALVCEPPSGSFFPLGDTRVLCQATDGTGNSTEASFVVRVLVDREPPQINCPTNRTVGCLGPADTPVFFIVKATDNADANVALVCVPPSGSLFPVGVTTVTCTAIDQCGNRAQSTFPVIVQDTAPPALSISLEANAVRISWPATCASYVFETARTLGMPAPWTTAPEAPVPTAQGYSVSVPVSDETGFYRLRREP
jgi:uncharacterized repeat protein (TIGR01451 family)